MNVLLQMPVVNILILSFVISIFTGIVLNVFFRDKVVDKSQIYYGIIFIGITYCITMVSILFMPSLMKGTGLFEFKFYEIIPFKGIVKLFLNGNYIQIIGSLFIVMPIPFLLHYIFTSVDFKKNMRLSIIFVILIEPIQLLINLLTNHPNFVIDINDFILNLVGVTLSLIMLKYIEKNEIINIYKKK